MNSDSYTPANLSRSMTGKNPLCLLPYEQDTITSSTKKVPRIQRTVKIPKNSGRSATTARERSNITFTNNATQQQTNVKTTNIYERTPNSEDEEGKEDSDREDHLPQITNKKPYETGRDYVDYPDALHSMDDQQHRRHLLPLRYLPQSSPFQLVSSPTKYFTSKGKEIMNSHQLSGKLPLLSTYEQFELFDKQTRFNKFQKFIKHELRQELEEEAQEQVRYDQALLQQSLQRYPDQIYPSKVRRREEFQHFHNDHGNQNKYYDPNLEQLYSSQPNGIHHRYQPRSDRLTTSTASEVRGLVSPSTTRGLVNDKSVDYHRQDLGFPSFQENTETEDFQPQKSIPNQVEASEKVRVQQKPKVKTYAETPSATNTRFVTFSETEQPKVRSSYDSYSQVLNDIWYLVRGANLPITSVYRRENVLDDDIKNFWKHIAKDVDASQWDIIFVQKFQNEPTEFPVAERFAFYEEITNYVDLFRLLQEPGKIIMKNDSFIQNEGKLITQIDQSYFYDIKSSGLIVWEGTTKKKMVDAIWGVILTFYSGLMPSTIKIVSKVSSRAKLIADPLIQKLEELPALFQSLLNATSYFSFVGALSLLFYEIINVKDDEFFERIMRAIRYSLKVLLNDKSQIDLLFMTSMTVLSAELCSLKATKGRSIIYQLIDSFQIESMTDLKEAIYRFQVPNATQDDVEKFRAAWVNDLAKNKPVLNPQMVSLDVFKTLLPDLPTSIEGIDLVNLRARTWTANWYQIRYLSVSRALRPRDYPRDPANSQVGTEPTDLYGDPTAPNIILSILDMFLRTSRTINGESNARRTAAVWLSKKLNDIDVHEYYSALKTVQESKIRGQQLVTNLYARLAPEDPSQAVLQESSEFKIRRHLQETNVYFAVCYFIKSTIKAVGKMDGIQKFFWNKGSGVPVPVNSGVEESEEAILFEDQFAFIYFNMQVVGWSEGSCLFNQLLQQQDLFNKIVSSSGWLMSYYSSSPSTSQRNKTNEFYFKLFQSYPSLKQLRYVDLRELTQEQFQVQVAPLLTDSENILKAQGKRLDLLFPQLAAIAYKMIHKRVDAGQLLENTQNRKDPWTPSLAPSLDSGRRKLDALEVTQMLQQMGWNIEYWQKVLGYDMEKYQCWFALLKVATNVVYVAAAWYGMEFPLKAIEKIVNQLAADDPERLSRWIETFIVIRRNFNFGETWNFLTNLHTWITTFLVTPAGQILHDWDFYKNYDSKNLLEIADQVMTNITNLYNIIWYWSPFDLEPDDDMLYDMWSFGMWKTYIGLNKLMTSLLLFGYQGCFELENW